MRGTTNIPNVCVVVKNGNKALFILRTNTGYKDNEYCVPAGHVEAGESFTQAACREAFEEVGIIIKPEDLQYKCTVQRQGAQDDIRIDVWFEAMAWEGEPKNMEPERHGKIEWIDLDNLPENLIDYMRYGFQNITQGISYGEFNWT